MSLEKSFPPIVPVEWLPAKSVLGGEASDFTPWLQRPENLEALGTALNLEELTAVATENNVLGKRLDILASAVDEDGEEIAVCIKNQYGFITLLQGAFALACASRSPEALEVAGRACVAAADAALA